MIINSSWFHSSLARRSQLNNVGEDGTANGISRLFWLNNFVSWLRIERVFSRWERYLFMLSLNGRLIAGNGFRFSVCCKQVLKHNPPSCLYNEMNSINLTLFLSLPELSDLIVKWTLRYYCWLSNGVGRCVINTTAMNRIKKLLFAHVFNRIHGFAIEFISKGDSCIMFYRIICNRIWGW